MSADETTDEWFARQLKRAHPESAADIDAATPGDEPRCAHGDLPPAHCRICSENVCAKCGVEFSYHGYRCGKILPFQSDEPLELGEPDTLHSLPIFVPREMEPVLRAVLAEVARQETGVRNGGVVVPASPSVLDFLVFRIGTDIRQLLRLKAGGA